MVELRLENFNSVIPSTLLAGFLLWKEPPPIFLDIVMQPMNLLKFNLLVCSTQSDPYLANWILEVGYVSF